MYVCSKAFIACAYGLCLAVTVTACSSNRTQPQTYLPQAATSTAIGSRLVFARAGTALVSIPDRTDHGPSWTSLEALTARQILIVSDDSTNDLYLFRLPSLKLVGKITGLALPQGLCDDANGNVWVINAGSGVFQLYSLDGKILKTLSDQGSYYPVGCSVNKATGDLAVTNLIGFFGGSGNLMVYPKGSGPPTVLTDKREFNYYFPVYDEKGNLLVDGVNIQGRFVLTKCDGGVSPCREVDISGGKPRFPGGLIWNSSAHYLLIGDQRCHNQFSSCEYRAKVTHYSAVVTASMSVSNFDGSACDVDQGALDPSGTYFAGPCITYQQSVSTAAQWAYPTGGKPTAYSKRVYYPIGSVIVTRQ